MYWLAAEQLAGIPQILINRESLGSRMRPTVRRPARTAPESIGESDRRSHTLLVAFGRQVFLQGECDDVIQRLAKVAADLEEAKSGVIDSVPRLAGARP